MIIFLLQMKKKSLVVDVATKNCRFKMLIFPTHRGLGFFVFLFFVAVVLLLLLVVTALQNLTRFVKMLE
jgi:hypothetical protein